MTELDYEICMSRRDRPNFGFGYGYSAKTAWRNGEVSVTAESLSTVSVTVSVGHSCQSSFDGNRN